MTLERLIIIAVTNSNINSIFRIVVCGECTEMTQETVSSSQGTNRRSPYGRATKGWVCNETAISRGERLGIDNDFHFHRQ